MPNSDAYQKSYTPRRRAIVNSSSQNEYSTPKSVKRLQVSVETPECFTKVLLETPKVKAKTSKDKCDEVSNLRVAVRIRPMNSTELATTDVEDVVRIKNNDLVICAPKNYHGITTDHIFQYDHVFWSIHEKDSLYSSQEDVFLTIGVPLLNSAFRGFNACLFAYGQTGSGKSYSMMGDINSEEYSGITPRFCRELFKRVSEIDKDCVVNVEVSYFEIYNEKIHDLLSEENSSRVPLKVREHPVLGPYIVDLTTHTVKSYEELRNYLYKGNKNRATAATSMNDFSSRSHSIFCIELGQCKGLDDTDNSRRSKVSLVDLAGSERLGSSFNNEEKMKQGVYINKSLLTLGKCISALSDQRKGQFVPYRESVLTWLLRESLGGNSLTSMLATISPASTHLDETLATLRYACQARSIVNRARINESPHDRMIRELRSEVERLKALRQNYERHSVSRSSSFNESNSQELDDVKSKLAQTETKLNEAQKMWEERFMETRKMQMKELAEAEKHKAELESKVRILNSVNDEISLSPFRTNFLEELEQILTGDKENICENDSLEIIKNWCAEKGYVWTFTGEDITIRDLIQKRQTSLCLKNISRIDLENSTSFLDNLKWIEIVDIEKKLTKAEITTTMNEIYKLLSNLRPSDNENHINLLYARINKLLQSFETALLGTVKNTKTVKWAP
ncbi:kinesin-like protein KIF14 [Sitophilus oryzae]|uniref:Kinesin-like protein n=1 Tax=Sitophilus oryzae TaxID=7048 RepID=A0A6J2XR20_SITOR|nr:kinesin-like protein KIF14 [Sitophilus oryzae]